MTYEIALRCLCAAVVLLHLACLLARYLDWSDSEIQPLFRTLVVLAVILLVLVLSGCGTRPLQAPISPQVPAALLIPPLPPVLLQAPSPSATPGTTTAPMPKYAVPTDWRISS